MYKFLADESGAKNAAQEKVCVVTGFLGNVEQWDIFNIEWKRVLNEFDVPLFHGLEFWDWHVDDESHQVVRCDPYRGWTEEDDFDFIDGLLGAIEKAKLTFTGTAIVIDYFLNLSEDERRWLTTSALYGKDWPQRGKPNDPWFTAFHSTVLNAATFVPIGEKVYPIFDIRDFPLRTKTPEHDKAKEIYQEILDSHPPVKVRDRLGEKLVFSTKEDEVGLQAADLLANRSRVYAVEGLGDSKLGNRIRDFLEKRTGYTKMLNVRGLDLLLRGCPFRSTFWKANDFKTAAPDYLEGMRGNAGLNVVAYKGVSTGRYYSHHIKAAKVRKVKKLGVSGSLVYITSPDESIPPNIDPQFDKEK